MKGDIHVFIFEDDEAATEVMKKHFTKEGAMTYAAVIDLERRPELVEAIDEVQNLL